MADVQITHGAGGTGPHPMARTHCMHDVALNVPCLTCFRNAEQMKRDMLAMFDRRQGAANG